MDRSHQSPRLFESDQAGRSNGMMPCVIAEEMDCEPHSTVEDRIGLDRRRLACLIDRVVDRSHQSPRLSESDQAGRSNGMMPCVIAEEMDCEPHSTVEDRIGLDRRRLACLIDRVVDRSHQSPRLFESGQAGHLDGMMPCVVVVG